MTIRLSKVGSFSLLFFSTISWFSGFSFAKCELNQLPPSLQEWILAEQTRMGRFFYVPKTHALEEDLKDVGLEYSPENQKIFSLKSYWVPENNLYVFMTPEQNYALPVLRRTQAGQTEYRLFVHPQSEGFYRKMVNGLPSGDEYCATPSSSHRTLLVWKEDRSVTPFFAKLSVNSVVGGENRALNIDEVTSSVGTSHVLSVSDIREGWGYLPEAMGIIPRGHEKGGMLIRLVPEDILAGKKRIIPLFSLYGNPKKGGVPFLTQMIQHSPLGPTRYVHQKLIRPFAQLWVRLALKGGWVPEAHGQNTLVGVDESGSLTGEFYFRDLGGIAMDLKYMALLGRPVPAELPFVRSVDDEYGQSAKEKAYWTYHDIWWFNNTLKVINLKVIEWMKAGLILGEPLASDAFETAFLTELHYAMADELFCDIPYPRSVLQVTKWVSDYREAKINHICISSFSRKKAKL